MKPSSLWHIFVPGVRGDKDKPHQSRKNLLLLKCPISPSFSCLSPTLLLYYCRSLNTPIVAAIYHVFFTTSPRKICQGWDYGYSPLYPRWPAEYLVVPNFTVVLKNKWINKYYHSISGFPGGAAVKESACQYRQCKRHEFDHCIGKIPWRKWQPTAVFLRGAWWATVHWLQNVGHD